VDATVKMEFFFCDKYSMQFTEEEAIKIKANVDRILKEEVSVLKENTDEDIALTRCRNRQDVDDMMFDKWALSVWPPEGIAATFIKLYCSDTVVVRAINTETNDYEKFEIGVLEAVEVLEDLQSFLWRSDDDNLLMARNSSNLDENESLYGQIGVENEFTLSEEEQD